jgi:predicted Zn finger-like uncharacterized protein
MTVIICPACGTRYEIAAEIPPEGRRVRCSKCAHVWQAKAVVEAPRAAPAAPGAPGAALKPRAPAPRPAAPPRPAPAAPAAKAPPSRPAAAPPTQPAKQPPGGFFPKPANGAPPLGNRTPPPPKPNIPFGSDEDFQPDVPGNGGATTISSWSSTEGSGADLGSYNAGALTNPEAEAAANVSIAGEGKKRKLPPPVAIGWGAFVLFLLIIAALVAMSPKTVVSMLPGANRLYAMLGSPVASNTLAIVDVRSSWTVAGGQQVLQVEGNIVNLTGGDVTVPIVVISMQDENGATLSEVGTKVPPLAAGAKGLFAVQIPTPPPAVRSVKVGFAKAE